MITQRQQMKINQKQNKASLIANKMNSCTKKSVIGERTQQNSGNYKPPERKLIIRLIEYER